MDTVRYILIEGVGTADARFYVAAFDTPAQPLVSRVVVYRMLHREPISRTQAESAILDLNRGGTGRGPSRIPEPAPGDDTPGS